MLDDDPGAAGTGTLFVEFHGGRVYLYRHVDEVLVAQLRAAGSPGGFFALRIKNAYPYALVRVVEAE